jgi:type I restriction enzyme, S subunit
MSDAQDQLIPLEQVAAPGPHNFVDGPFGSEMKSSEYSERGVRLVQLQNIGDGYWIDDNKKFIPLEKFETLRRHGAIPGDIAIAKMADPVARSCVLPAVADQFIVVADCIKLTPDPERFDARFVSSAINSHRTRREAETKSSGTTRLRINLSALKTVHIWAPPLSEQRQIALTLDTVDEVIVKTGAVISKLRQVRAGLLHDLLIRGLDEHGQLRDPVAHPEQFQDSLLGLVPREWEVVTVESIGATKRHAIVDGPFGSNLKTIHYRDNGIPVIQSGYVTSGEFLADSYVYVDQDLFEEQRRSAVEPGDIVMAKIGAQCGTCAILPDGHPIGILAGNSLKISTNNNVCRAAFLLEILHYYYALGIVDRIKSETAQPAISLKHLRAMLIPRPSLQEQDAIVSCLTCNKDTLKAEQANLSKLQQLKSGLMADLLTGRVRVPESVSVVENQL